MEGSRKVNRKIRFYNLDAIISVGYRVNSKRGTQFRIWSNKVLKDYLIRGYSLNERKLAQQNKELNQLKEAVKILGNVLEYKELYPSIEEKAANLFLYFLDKNGALRDDDGRKRIPDNALVAITLMIAVSKPEEKETMTKVVVNLINKRN